MNMVEVTDSDIAAGDNVHPFPRRAPEPQPRRTVRSKDRRATARQAKRRSKIKPDRDASAAKALPVYAPPDAPTVTRTDGDRVTLPAPVTPPEWRTMAPVERPARRHGAAGDFAAYPTAIGLAWVAALFSIQGMVQLFPGAPLLIIAMASMMEAGKLVTAGWLARRWRATAWFWRYILVALVAGLAVINAAGVYAQLVAAHVGDRGQAASHLEAQTADIDAKISVQAHIVADLDRRLAQIDAAVEKATEKGRTTAAMKLADDQRRARAGLAEERKHEAGTLATLQAERTTVAAKGRQIDTAGAPIRFVPELSQ